MFPADAPPFVTGVQGGEKKIQEGKSLKITRGVEKSKKIEKIVTTGEFMKVVSTQVPRRIVSKVSTIEAIKTMKRPIPKGIFIGSST